jgi:tRNA (guanine37-N1)-methyltransferase
MATLAQMGNIETQFRTFPLEVLAGDDDLEVELRESNAVFHFNFSEVGNV